MTRRIIFAGNWKMYKTFSEAESHIKGIAAGLNDTGGKEVAVFPPSVYVRDIVKLCRGAHIDVGIQNVYFEKEGAFTGEISPVMAKDTGVRYVLIGHSERRHVFGEKDENVNKKVKAVLAAGLEPMVCVGELLEEREAGTSDDVIKRQIKAAFSGIDAADMKKIVIAYEPVWAIGTGKVATPETAETMHKLIRDTLKLIYNSGLSESIPVLYGGSVKPDNIAGLIAMENIDGVLVGGASLKVDSFLDIINVKNK
ncbi:MAG: triose-phosphate isomerase [Spirochaetes bacterium]|nr:triose-phosphate isomerase [Spirochaetota bacterium]